MYHAQTQFILEIELQNNKLNYINIAIHNKRQRKSKLVPKFLI